MGMQAEAVGGAGAGHRPGAALLTPGVILWNPKYGHNVGGALRTCSAFHIPQLVWTGGRVTLDVAKGQRLPREERMKGYRDVDMLRHDRPFDIMAREAVPVAIEVRAHAEQLPAFIHPEHAVYVFGPEDGSLPSTVLAHCHRFVVIPTAHCLNLATAVTVVLYDRLVKRYAAGLDDLIAPGEHEGRGPVDNVEVFAGVSSAGLGKLRRT